jgi:hypothetical protein
MKIKLIGVVILSGIIAAGCSDVDVPSESASTPPESASAPAAEEKESSVVTKVNYDKIKNGDVMTGEGGSTLQEVLEIMGEPSGKSESEFNGNIVKRYDWNDLWGSGTMINVTFTNDKVSDKLWIE